MAKLSTMSASVARTSTSAGCFPRCGPPPGIELANPVEPIREGGRRDDASQQFAVVLDRVLSSSHPGGDIGIKALGDAAAKQREQGFESIERHSV